MAIFETAHKETSLIEGGYVNDPTDTGGETYRGISRKYFPTWEGWRYIDEVKKNTSLKRGQYIDSKRLDLLVEGFYKKYFWDINKLDLIRCQEVAAELFDTGVNMGVKTAAKFLQRALNLLNRNQKDYKDLKVDGMIGNVTISITNNIRNHKALLKTLNGLQFSRYVGICKRNPAQEKFFLGWLNRVT